MLVLPVGNYSPVAPVAPVARVVARKAKPTDKSGGATAMTRPARSASGMASHNTRAALDEMKLGG
ncbi:MAG: hypothetical protein KGM15_00910 [Pseudomonadota bacterium]|nr:hypothetical protein [Pseudomonadota bacterium]